MAGEQPQWLRLVDVLVIGPYMIRSAAEAKSPIVRGALVLAAAAAIAFNASDWLRDFPERGFVGERKRNGNSASAPAQQLGRGYLASSDNPAGYDGRNPRRLSIDD